MPTYKRYVVRQDTRILFFTSKPVSWSRAYWKDINGQCYRIASIVPKEASDFDGLLELPEGKLLEVEMRIKVKDK